MKKIIKKLIFFSGVFFISILFFYLYSFQNTFSLSNAQKEIINNLGRPDQFVITYLPQGDEKLIRSELWFYFSTKQKFSFLGGELVDSEKIKENISGRSSTILKTEDFDFYTSFKDIKKRKELSDLNLVDAPVFNDKENDLQTYVSAKAIFIFEKGYLSYMETLD